MLCRQKGGRRIRHVNICMLAVFQGGVQWSRLLSEAKVLNADIISSAKFGHKFRTNGLCELIIIIFLV